VVAGGPSPRQSYECGPSHQGQLREDPHKTDLLLKTRILRRRNPGHLSTFPGARRLLPLCPLISCYDHLTFPILVHTFRVKGVPMLRSRFFQRALFFLTLAVVASFSAEALAGQVVCGKCDLQLDTCFAVQPNEAGYMCEEYSHPCKRQRPPVLCYGPSGVYECTVPAPAQERFLARKNEIGRSPESPDQTAPEPRPNPKDAGKQPAGTS